MIGFTGPRTGMTHRQRETLEALLRLTRQMVDRHEASAGNDFHHGLCVGSDEQANEIARRLGFRTIGHPASDVDPVLRSDAACSVVWQPAPALDRNSVIATYPILFATPREEFGGESARSGTWATIRRGLNSPGTVVYVVRPSGRVEVTP